MFRELVFGILHHKLIRSGKGIYNKYCFIELKKIFYRMS